MNMGMAALEHAEKMLRTSEQNASKWAAGDDERKRLVQCPGCWTAAMARKDVDWECECGELMTVVDLREVSNQDSRGEA